MNTAIVKRAFRYIFRGITTAAYKYYGKNFTTRRLEGRKILITGGGKGIGYWIAKKCVSEGAKVLICGRQEETLRRACRELGESCQYIKLMFLVLLTYHLF